MPHQAHKPEPEQPQTFREMMSEQTALLRQLDARQEEFCGRLTAVEIELVGEIGRPETPNMRRSIATAAQGLQALAGQVDSLMKREKARRAVWSKLGMVLGGAAIISAWHWFTGEAKPPHP